MAQGTTCTTHTHTHTNPFAAPDELAGRPLLDMAVTGTHATSIDTEDRRHTFAVVTYTVDEKKVVHKNR
jgi:hypothetical protein